MSNLDNLVSKIIGNSEEKARQIIQAAKEQAAGITGEKAKEAEKEKSAILEQARGEAEKIKARVLSDKSLELRDKRIYAKREAIQRVFEDAVKRLNDMPEEQFKEYLKKRLSGAKLESGTEIIMPVRYAKINLSDINPSLKPHKGGRTVAGGFVLVSGGVEENETFSALVNYYKDELETTVIQNLF